MKVNGVRIEICLNNGNGEEATQKAREILSALNIEYTEEIEFTPVN